MMVSSDVEVYPNPNMNRMGIQERFSQTDRALEEVPSWPQVQGESPHCSHIALTTADTQVPHQHQGHPHRSGSLGGFQIKTEVPNTT